MQSKTKLAEIGKNSNCIGNKKTPCFHKMVFIINLAGTTSKDNNNKITLNYFEDKSFKEYENYHSYAKTKCKSFEKGKHVKI